MDKARASRSAHARVFDVLDAGGEADQGRRGRRVEGLEHALHRLPVDPEGDAGSVQIHTAAHHVIRRQQMLLHRPPSSGRALHHIPHTSATAALRGIEQITSQDSEKHNNNEIVVDMKIANNALNTNNK